MKRPDHKQEFVSRWQDDFNSIPDDMRSDDDTKVRQRSGGERKTGGERERERE